MSTGNQLQRCPMREFLEFEWLTIWEFLYFVGGLVTGASLVGLLWWWRETVRRQRRHYRQTGAW